MLLKVEKCTKKVYWHWAQSMTQTTLKQHLDYDKSKLYSPFLIRYIVLQLWQEFTSNKKQIMDVKTNKDS